MTCSTCKTSAAPYELRDGKCHSCTHAELIYEREQRSNLANMAEYEMLRLKLTQSQLESMLVRHKLVYASAFDDPEGFDAGETKAQVILLLADINAGMKGTL